MAVVANSATTFSIVGVTGLDTAIRLIDGMPQASMTNTSQLSRKYIVQVAGTHTDLTVSLVMQYGVAHIYANRQRDASIEDHRWSSAPLSTGALMPRSSCDHITLRCSLVALR